MVSLIVKKAQKISCYILFKPFLIIPLKRQSNQDCHCIIYVSYCIKRFKKDVSWLDKKHRDEGTVKHLAAVKYGAKNRFYGFRFRYLSINWNRRDIHLVNNYTCLPIMHGCMYYVCTVCTSICQVYLSLSNFISKWPRRREENPAVLQTGSAAFALNRQWILFALKFLCL